MYGGFDHSSHHNARRGKGTFRQQTVVAVARSFSVATTFGNIPGHWTWMRRIGIVRACLTIYAHNPQGNNDDIHEHTEDRVPCMHDEEDELDQHDEHRKD